MSKAATETIGFAMCQFRMGIEPSFRTLYLTGPVHVIEHARRVQSTFYFRSNPCFTKCQSKGQGIAYFRYHVLSTLLRRAFVLWKLMRYFQNILQIIIKLRNSLKIPRHDGKTDQSFIARLLIYVKTSCKFNIY